MKIPLCTLLLSFGLTAILSAQDREWISLPETDQELPGVGPVKLDEKFTTKWQSFREKWLPQEADDKGGVVFLGDSITAGWRDDFRGLFPGIKTVNRGIGGDTTRGMLIRLDDVVAVDPSAVVMLMGTNDLGVDGTPDDAASNVEQIIQKLEEHNSELPIVLCLVFPSSEEKNRPKEQITALNELYTTLAKEHPQVTVVDTWTLFANEEGDAKAELFPDLLHLNAEGYQTWANALHPIFATLELADTEAEEFTPEEGYVSLFNGKDLTGWGFRPTPPRKQPKKPRPNAPKFVEITEAVSFDGKTQSSDGRYQVINGRLVVTTPIEGRRIQQLWTTEEFPTDFILKLEFRATPNADSGVFIRQPQLQCRDYWLAGPYYDLEGYKPQDWNELIVTVKGNTAMATCNGQILEEAMELPETGPIGLEGDRGQMEYRRIQIKKLP